MSLVEDGDAPGDLADEFHIVFDYDDTVFSFEAEEEFAGAFCFLVAHAGSWFINKKDTRFLSEEHSDFEPLFLAVGKKSCEFVSAIGEANGLKNLFDGLLVSGGHFVKESLENAAGSIE